MSRKRSAFVNASDPDDISGQELWPPRVKKRTRLTKWQHLPKGLLRIYAETNTARDAGHAILSGIGIRAIVEAVCSHKRARGHNLKIRINDMVKKGILTKPQSRALQKARILGNQAAHDLQRASPEALEAAMSVAEHMLTGVYLMAVMAKTVAQKAPKATS